MPSLKYSFSGSALALTNGSTAMARASPRAWHRPTGTSGTGVTSASANSAMRGEPLARGLRQRAGERPLHGDRHRRAAATRIGAGVSMAWRAMVARAPVPANGGSPASIS